MDLMKAFGLVDKHPKEIDTMQVLKDFIENCGDYGQILKGGMALNYYYESKYPSARSTVDLDFHIKQEEIWKNFKEKSCECASRNSKLGLVYSIVKEKVNPNGESLSIESFSNNKLISKFKIDMNYGSYCKINNKFKFSIYSVESILADKISVVCSPKILRRTKDLYDVYLIISNEEFSMLDLAKEIRRKLSSVNRSLNVLYLLKPEYLEKLEYAYYKIKLLDFPDFKEIVDADVNFILPLIDSINEKYNDDTNWNREKKFWEGKISGSAVLDSLEGIVCKESASGMLGLSTFPPYPLLVYNSYIDLNLRSFRFIKTNIDNVKYKRLKDNIFITTKEQTICDLLIDGEFRILMESLESYIDENNDLDLLCKLADKMNLTTALNKALKELEIYKNEI